MALPTSRAEFKEYCLRQLGKPVIDINVSDEQVEDKIDYCLSYYADYHFDGSETIYYKHKITAADKPDAVKTIRIDSGGTGYSNGASVVFSGQHTNEAVATVTTDVSGTITSITFSGHGSGYPLAPTATVAGGSGANLVPELGGWIELPDNILGVVKLFDISSAMGSSTSDMFSITYQIALNDLWSFMSSSLVPYYMTMQHISLMQQILVGSPQIRYSRHRNRLHIDINWSKLQVDAFLAVQANEVIDPEVFTDVYKDRWLLRYVTTHIKSTWGSNMKKYQGMPMPGGVLLNGQQIYDEAIEEIKMLEDQMINTYGLSPEMAIG